MSGFPLREVKKICERIRGREISGNAWSNWRKWAKCKPGLTTVPKQQCLYLMAIAQIRRDVYRDELNWFDITRVASDLEKEYDRLFLKIEFEGMILGAELLKLLPGRTVYRKIPGFSVNRYYDRAWAFRHLSIN